MCVVILISDLPPTESSSIYHTYTYTPHCFYLSLSRNIPLSFGAGLLFLSHFFFVVPRLMFSMCLASALYHYSTFNRFSSHCLHSLCLLFSKENYFLSEQNYIMNTKTKRRVREWRRYCFCLNPRIFISLMGYFESSVHSLTPSILVNKTRSKWKEKKQKYMWTEEEEEKDEHQWKSYGKCSRERKISNRNNSSSQWAFLKKFHHHNCLNWVHSAQKAF